MNDQPHNPRKPTALVKPPKPSPLARLHQQFDEGRYNLLLPKVHVGELPAGTQLAVREVRVDAKNDSDVYPVEGGKLALTKVALNKISAAAGITWLNEERTDDRRHPHLCEYRVHGRVVDFDGTVRDIWGTKCVDLRDDADGQGTPGKDKAACKTPKQLAQARKFIDSICISKARNRAVADVLGISRAYSAQALSKPFIVPKLAPDTSNPVTQQAVLAGMLGATQAMFGPTNGNGNVVDMSFEEEPPEPAEGEPSRAESAGQEEGGASACAPPSSTEYDEVGPPPMDENNEAIEIVKRAWVLAKEHKMTGNEFVTICQTVTGKERKEDMTAAEAQAVFRAVNSAVMGGGNNDDDGCPV